MKRTRFIKKDDFGKRKKIIDVRPLDERLKGKRMRPGQQADAKEQLLFNNNENSLPDLDTDLASFLPDYVKKHLKHKNRIQEHEK